MDGHTDRIQNLKLTLEEARREYELKTERLEEIDDKALRLSRTATLVIGFAVSAVSVGGSSALLEIPAPHALFLSLGLTMTLLTAVLGIGVSSVTDYLAGIGTEQRTEASCPPYGHQSALSTNIEQYESMIDEVTQEVRWNTRVLDSAQILLLLGTFLLFIGSGRFVSLVAIETLVPSDNLSLFFEVITLLPPIILFSVGIELSERISMREQQTEDDE